MFKMQNLNTLRKEKLQDIILLSTLSGLCISQIQCSSVFFFFPRVRTYMVYFLFHVHTNPKRRYMKYATLVPISEALSDLIFLNAQRALIGNNY